MHKMATEHNKLCLRYVHYHNNCNKCKTECIHNILIDSVILPTQCGMLTGGYTMSI